MRKMEFERNSRMLKELNLQSGNKKENWKLFHQTWKNYEIASSLNEKTNDVRVATLLSVIGEDALRIYNTFEWSNPEDCRDIDQVLQRFEKYCTPKVNLTYERYKFNTRKQESGEDIDRYVVALKVLANNCEFGALRDSLITDMLVLGVADERLRENLLRDADLNLEKAISMAQAAERCAKQNNVLQGNDANDVDELRKTDLRKERKPGKCWFCGYDHSFKEKRNCPAFGKVCFKCNGKNHFSSQCKKKEVLQVDEVKESANDRLNELYIG